MNDKPELKDYVYCETLIGKNEDEPLMMICGEVRALSYVLDNEDKVHLQYLVRRADGSQITVGEPIWTIRVVDKNEC